MSEQALCGCCVLLQVPLLIQASAYRLCGSWGQTSPCLVCAWDTNASARPLEVRNMRQRS